MLTLNTWEVSIKRLNLNDRSSFFQAGGKARALVQHD